MMAIAWNKLSHSESLHKSGSAYKPPHFLTNRRRVPPKPFSHSLGRLQSFNAWLTHSPEYHPLTPINGKQLVSKNAIDWSSPMQTSGQVDAITHYALRTPDPLLHTDVAAFLCGYA